MSSNSPGINSLKKGKNSTSLTFKTDLKDQEYRQIQRVDKQRPRVDKLNLQNRKLKHAQTFVITKGELGCDNEQSP